MDQLIEHALTLASQPAAPLIAPIKNRIAYVVSHGQSYASHGYAIRTQGVAKALNEHGFDTLCFVRPGRPWELGATAQPESTIDGVRYIHSRWINDIQPANEKAHLEQSVQRFVELFRVYRPQVVLAASNYIVGLPAWIAAKRLDLPFYNEVRGFWELSRDAREPGYADTSEFKAEALRDIFVAKQAKKVFTLNQPMADELEKRGLADGNVSIVPNGVKNLPEIQPADPQLKEKLGIKDEKIIGYIGSFNTYEGLDTLKIACEKLISQGIKIKLLLVGDDQPVTQHLAKNIAQDNRNWLIHAGRVPHEKISEYYAIIDVVVIPRKSSPVCELVPPMKATEAITYQCALLTSGVTPLVDLAKKYPQIHTFTESDSNDLYKKIINILSTKKIDKKNQSPSEKHSQLSELLYKNSISELVRTIKQKTKERSIYSLSILPENRLIESMAEALLLKDKHTHASLIKEINHDYEKIARLTNKANSRFEELKECIPERQKKLLVAGHDLRFIQPYIKYLSKYYEVSIDQWNGLDSHNLENTKKLVANADIIWCEWCCGNAVWYSRNKPTNSKLFIRLHRFEYTTSFPNLVEWENVDNLIFIAEGIKEKVNDKFKIKCQQSIIYNCYDVDSFVKSSWTTKRDILSLSMIGFMPKLKRLDLALDLLEELNSEDTSFDLHLKGKRPEELDWVWNKESNYFEHTYERINKINKLNRKIHIEGYSNNVPTWIAGKGFLISSSDIEGSHQAVAEAMAAGTIPLIIGKWASDYKASKMYPSEFIFNSIEDAKNYVIRVIKSGCYNTISKRVQRFAIENFSPDIVMHSALELLAKGKTKINYIPISNGNNISILSDLNANVVDGSSIWLKSIIDTLLLDKNNSITLFSKVEISENSEFHLYKNNKRIVIHEFPSLENYSEKEFLDFYLKNSNQHSNNKTIIRASNNLAKEILDADKEIQSKFIYYIVGKLQFEISKLEHVSSILVQTESSLKEIKEILTKHNIKKDIVILPPMIPDCYTAEKNKISNTVKIVYSGKLCKDYMSLEMAQYANNLSEHESFSIVASKYYKQDGEDYIKKTKSHINAAIKKGKSELLGPITRDETAKIIKNSNVGWLLRDEKFKHSPEISTKLLEYCALGKPPILNKFRSNIELLGEDYPLYVSSQEEIKSIIRKISENPDYLNLISEYCSYVSAPYKMEQTLKRITPLLFSNKIRDCDNKLPKNSFSNFTKYYKLSNSAQQNAISIHELSNSWHLLDGDSIKIEIKNNKSKKNIKIKSLFSSPQNRKPAIVTIKLDGVNVDIDGFKKTSSGDYFEYINADQKIFSEQNLLINTKKHHETITLEIKKWNLTSDAAFFIEDLS